MQVAPSASARVPSQLSPPNAAAGQSLRNRSSSRNSSSSIAIAIASTLIPVSSEKGSGEISACLCCCSCSRGEFLLGNTLRTSSRALTSRRLWTDFSRSGEAGFGRLRRRREGFRGRFSTMSISSSDTSRKVTIKNSAGQNLAGVINDTKSNEIVILCHGFRSSKESGTLNSIAEAILKAGISTFRFDFTGNGESEGEFMYGHYWREAEDLRSVVLHWRAEGRQVAAIVGHSKGGSVVVLYASKYDDVSTVINLSGRFDLTTGTEARFGKKGMKKLYEDGFLEVKEKSGDEYRVTLDSLQDRLATDMDAASRAISMDVRVLTIHGDQDEVVAVENAHDFAKRIPNHSLKIVDGGSHNYDKHQAELCALVVEFLQAKQSRI